LASAKSPCQIQVPNKTGDEQGTHGGKYPRVPTAAVASATAFGFRMTVSEGSLGGGGRAECQPWGPVSFLIILVQGFFFVLGSKESPGAETICPRSYGYFRSQKC